MATQTRTAGERGAQPKEPHLDGLLAEFRTALRDEIEAARKAAASGAVSLIEGHRFSGAAGAFQYRFRVESALNLPDDSPGDLIVPGHGPLEASVLAVEGLAISVSVAEDLGEFVPRARLQTNLVFLLRKLVTRIEEMADRANPAGTRLLGTQSPAGEPRLPDNQAEVLAQLNAEQSAAVASALGRDTTFIWGPPGTGKTKTIGAIGTLAYRSERSVLVVSHTNAAVDQALLHVADALGIEDGSVLRLGAPRDQRLAERPELLAETHIARRSKELVEEQAQLEERRRELTTELNEIERLLALDDWLGEAETDIASWRQELQQVEQLERGLEEALRRRMALAEDAPSWTIKLNAAQAMVARAAALPELDERVARGQLLLSGAEEDLRGAEEVLAEAEQLLQRTTAASGLVRRWRGLPKPEAQEIVVAGADAEVAAAHERQEAAQAALHEARAELNAVGVAIAAFTREHEAEPQQLLAAAEAFSAEFQSAQAVEEELRGDAGQARIGLEDQLRDRVGAVKAWGLISGDARGAEQMLQLLAAAVAEAKRQLAGQDLTALNARQIELVGEISAIDIRLAEIEEALTQVEELVIAEARVVATTLTRAYLRDSIQKRRFDTVILDEASMAPIPALWVAAAVAEANVVLVGDFKQLPPISQADEGPAKKWLGRDVFEAAGIRQAWEEQRPPAHFVALRRQYRMHPTISSIANTLIYDDKLVDDPSAGIDGGLEWYRRDWGHDTPLLLVDTESINAWVTSVAGARGSSRLNFLSATVCVDIAERLLADDRVELPMAAGPRILICAPYRPQVRLLGLLIKDQDIEREVVAGTAHSFQGNEADVVIFDLVNDEPHHRVGLFTPAHDESNRRMLNVALTRPRRRLIVVGDFPYITRLAKNAFLGGKLIPALQAAGETVRAVDIVPEGLAARAAQAQRRTAAGPVEAPAERIVVTQADFFRFLASDLAKAREQVTIYSPFITNNGLSRLETELKAAIERGVVIYVVTKTRGERGQRDQEQYRSLETALESWGVILIHKFHMHEKVVFVDGQILWTGSLNPLSFSDTQEIMERRANAEVARDYARTLRHAEMVDLYIRADASCPICGQELGPAEGADEPFYWRCVNEDCAYSRSIDQPAPTNGLIPCANCGEPVKFGQWGSDVAWRCTANPRHRQRIAKAHLRLPKMAALIPKRELRTLEKRWGLTTAPARASRGRRPREDAAPAARDPVQLDFHYVPGGEWV